MSMKVKQPKLTNAQVSSNKMVFNCEPRSFRFSWGCLCFKGGLSTPATSLIHYLSAQVSWCEIIKTMKTKLNKNRECFMKIGAID